MAWETVRSIYCWNPFLSERTKSPFDIGTLIVSPYITEFWKQKFLKQLPIGLDLKGISQMKLQSQSAQPAFPSRLWRLYCQRGCRLKLHSSLVAVHSSLCSHLRLHFPRCCTAKSCMCIMADTLFPEEEVL